MNRSRILVVEDDNDVRQALCTLLRRDYSVEGVGDAESALNVIAEKQFDLVILDVGLPSMDGYKFCAALRAQETTVNIPVIFFTGRLDIEDKLVGFSLGANDYICKTADMREIRARVQVQLNLAKGGNKSDIVNLGPFKLNANSQTIAIENGEGGIDLQVSPLEFRLMHFFLTHAEKVFTREQLLDAVWGNQRNVNDRSVDVVISKLRTKMGSFGELLHSVRGVGYRFNDPRSVSSKKSA